MRLATFFNEIFFNQDATTMFPSFAYTMLQFSFLERPRLSFWLYVAISMQPSLLSSTLSVTTSNNVLSLQTNNIILYKLFFIYHDFCC